MRFLRRLLVVCLVAAGIVAAGWGIKHVDPVYAYFQKGGSPDGVEGGHEGQTPEAAEAEPAGNAEANPPEPEATNDPAPPATTAEDAPKLDEATATPGDDTDRPPKDGDVPRDDPDVPPVADDTTGATAASAAGDTFAGDEAAHPTGEDGKEGDTAHEQWPALNFDDAGHAATFMLPTVATVVMIDLIRRKRRKPIRLVAPANAH